MPMLAPIRTSMPSTVTPSSSARAMRRPTGSASAASARIAANSSPPRRARTSPERSTAQAGADLLEDDVAGAVAEGVVEVLETVEVDHEQRDRRAALARGVEVLAQAAVKMAAVRQRGQVVRVRQAADL